MVAERSPIDSQQSAQSAETGEQVAVLKKAGVDPDSSQGADSKLKEGHETGLNQQGQQFTSNEQAEASNAVESGPTDEQVLQQINEIKAEQEEIPYIGDKEQLSSLEKEYSRGSQVFVSKIKKLGEKYSHVRRTRGDGNCFYRSFIFAYLEHIIMTRNTAEKNKCLDRIEDNRKKLIAEGFQDIVFEDPLAILIALVQAADVEGDAVVTPDGLQSHMQDDSTSNMMVMFMRFVTSCEIRRRYDFFEPFILGMWDVVMTVEQFCQRHVEAMGEESDHVHIVALTDALHVPVRVVYLDSNSSVIGVSSGNENECQYHDFVPEQLTKNQTESTDIEPIVHILYRPGHYDILYPRTSAST